MQNTSPRTLAVILAIMLSTIAGIIIGMNMLFKLEHTLLFLIFSILAIFVISFVVAFYIFSNLIINKITPIYRTINSISELDKNISDKFVEKDVIYEANKEVINWVKQKSAEIQGLKASEKFRKEFVANVAHELKTPIFNIQGYVLTLLDGGLEDNKVNRKYLKRTEKNINRLIATIKDIDTISRLESGVLKLNKQKFNIVELISEVFEMQDLTAKEYNILLKFDGNFSDSITVFADKKHIFEVLNNLVVNSIKYGKAEGTTQISIKYEDSKIRVEVKDNGIGIEKEHLPQIFQRFYRVDKSRSRERGGSGLGLAIVKHIIEAHEETISVVSEINVGSTFYFTLQKAV